MDTDSLPTPKLPSCLPDEIADWPDLASLTEWRDASDIAVLALNRATQTGDPDASASEQAAMWQYGFAAYARFRELEAAYPTACPKCREVPEDGRCACSLCPECNELAQPSGCCACCF